MRRLLKITAIILIQAFLTADVTMLYAGDCANDSANIGSKTLSPRLSIDIPLLQSFFQLLEKMQIQEELTKAMLEKKRPSADTTDKFMLLTPNNDWIVDDYITAMKISLEIAKGEGIIAYKQEKSGKIIVCDSKANVLDEIFERYILPGNRLSNLWEYDGSLREEITNLHDLFWKRPSYNMRRGGTIEEFIETALKCIPSDVKTAKFQTSDWMIPEYKVEAPFRKVKDVKTKKPPAKVEALLSKPKQKNLKNVDEPKSNPSMRGDTVVLKVPTVDWVIADYVIAIINAVNSIQNRKTIPYAFNSKVIINKSTASFLESIDEMYVQSGYSKLLSTKSSKLQISPEVNKAMVEIYNVFNTKWYYNERKIALFVGTVMKIVVRNGKSTNGNGSSTLKPENDASLKKTIKKSRTTLANDTIINPKEVASDELDKIIAEVIGVKDIETVRKQLQRLPEWVINKAYDKRYNLWSSTYKDVFRNTWMGLNDPAQAIKNLSAGFVIEHELPATGLFRLDKLPTAIRGEIPNELLGMNIYIYRGLGSKKANLEWMFFPEIGSWLPIEISSSHLAKPVALKTILDVKDKKVRKIGKLFPGQKIKELSKKYKGLIVCSKISTEGLFVVGARRLNINNIDLGKFGNHKFINEKRQIVQVFVDENGFENEFWFGVNTDSIKLRQIITKDKKGRVTNLIETFRFFGVNLLGQMAEAVGIFWVKSRVERFFSGGEESAVLKAGSRKIAEFDRTVEYNFFLKSAAYIGQAAQIMYSDLGIPVYITVEGNPDDGLDDIQQFLKRLEIRNAQGKVIDVLGVYNSTVPSESIMLALKWAEKLKGELVITGIDVKFKNESGPNCESNVGGQRLYVSKELGKGLPLKLSAEIVYDARKSDEAGYPVPVKYRAGRYVQSQNSSQLDPLRFNDIKFKIFREYSLRLTEKSLLETTKRNSFEAEQIVYEKAKEFYRHKFLVLELLEQAI